MSCIWWNSISGSTIAPTACEANSTLAIGMPLARLFLEPQKTMVISSSMLKPKRRAMKVVRPSASASSTPHTSSRPSSALTGICFQSPSITAALKAV
ncbi:hypothetical protein D3C72_1787010 [compost metagenome]